MNNQLGVGAGLTGRITCDGVRQAYASAGARGSGMGRQGGFEDVHVESGCGAGSCCASRPGLALWPPSARSAGNADGVQHGRLGCVEACGAGAVLGVFLEGSLQPDALSVGAQAKDGGRDAPRSFAFGVGPRAWAGVVVAAEASGQVACLARVGRGPPVRGEDVAAEGFAEVDGAPGRVGRTKTWACGRPWRSRYSRKRLTGRASVCDCL